MRADQNISLFGISGNRFYNSFMINTKSKALRTQKILETYLKEIRVNSGMRQLDAANALGVQQSIVSKYEAGERRLDIIEIRILCKLFGISLVDFIKELEMRLERHDEAD
jgi:ribosome-binding protein aMBF1 (putative translation factor)